MISLISVRIVNVHTSTFRSNSVVYRITSYSGSKFRSVGLSNSSV